MKSLLNKEDILIKVKYGFERFYGENSYLLENIDYKPGKKVYRNMSSINKIMNLFIELDTEYLDKAYIVEKYSWDGSSTYVQHERIITNFNLSEILWMERRRPCIVLNNNGIRLLKRYKKYKLENPEVNLMDEKNYVIPNFAIDYIIKSLKETKKEDITLWKNCLMTTLYLGIELGYIPKYRVINKKVTFANEKEEQFIRQCCRYINNNGVLMDLSYFDQVVAMLLDLKLVKRESDSEIKDVRIVKYYLNDNAFYLLNNMNIFKEYENLEYRESRENEHNKTKDLLQKKIVEIEIPLKTKKNIITRNKINKKGTKRNYEKENKNKSEIGRKGEMLILEYERRKLETHNIENIKDKLIWASEEFGDGIGYDIISYDIETKSKMYIEVKATKKEKDEAFFITSSELRFSRENSKNYYLYRVYGLDDENNKVKFYKVNGYIREHFNTEAIGFLVKR